MPALSEIHFHLFEGRKEGQGNDVVLVHGAGGNYLSWPVQMRRISGLRVYALDLPGHGKSGGVGLQSIQAYADTVVRWFSAVGLSKVVLVGHSMGSAIAMKIALEYPDAVSGMILIGAGPRLDVNPRLLEECANQTTFLSAIEKIVMWSFSQETPQRMVELVGKRMAETRQGVLYGDFVACSAFDETERLAQIKQPVLVITGELDRMVPCRQAQLLADHIENSTFKVIPNAGHMAMLERPEAVAQEMLNFLAKIQ